MAALAGSFERGYCFCEVADELEQWERQWAEVKYTQITSVITGVLAPYARLFPKSRWFSTSSPR